MGIASLTGRLGNMIAPFTATVVCIYSVYLLSHTFFIKNNVLNRIQFSRPVHYISVKLSV